MNPQDIPFADEFTEQNKMAVTSEWLRGWNALRTLLNAGRQLDKDTCTCGSPSTLNMIHRTEGPCVNADQSALSETVQLLEDACDEVLLLKTRVKTLEDEQRGWAQMNATLQTSVKTQRDIISVQEQQITKLRLRPQ